MFLNALLSYRNFYDFFRILLAILEAENQNRKKEKQFLEEKKRARPRTELGRIRPGRPQIAHARVRTRGRRTEPHQQQRPCSFPFLCFFFVLLFFSSDRWTPGVITNLLEESITRTRFGDPIWFHKIRPNSLRFCHEKLPINTP
jgi:hypothetical protein